MLSPLINGSFCQQFFSKSIKNIREKYEKSILKYPLALFCQYVEILAHPFQGGDRREQ